MRNWVQRRARSLDAPARRVEGSDRASDAGCATAVLALLGGPVAVVAAVLLVHLYVDRMMACTDFDAGNRFAALFEIPLVAAALWLAFTVPAVIGVALRLARVGFIVGLLAIVILGYGYLLQVPQNADGPDEYVTCPDGVPTWWPWFLPH
jgi:hypothetical protein